MTKINLIKMDLAAVNAEIYYQEEKNGSAPQWLIERAAEYKAALAAEQSKA